MLQVRFYEVPEAELEEQFELFTHGLYEPKTTTEIFDVSTPQDLNPRPFRLAQAR